jgi:trimethylamine-N-oxide reductase (cytochrome c)
MIHKGILNPPQSWYSTTSAGASVKDQFVKYTYPIAEEDGGSEIHMIWTDMPCNTGCWNGSNYHIEAYRDSKIEFLLAQHPWFE